MLADVDTGLSVYFSVSLDILPAGEGPMKTLTLGDFTSCEGLGCEVVLESREEGGNNDFIWQLPSRLKYPNITLTRPLGRDTEKIAKWFASMTTGFTRPTGVIQAMGPNNVAIASWSLYDVVPVRWKGPSLNADQPKVIVETLEIAHHGFVLEVQNRS